MRDPDSAHTGKDQEAASIPASEMLIRLQALRQALWQEGFDVAISAPALTARNNGVRGENRVGQLLCPGLSQEVIVQDRDGQLWFFWAWPRARKSHRDADPAEPEYGPLCPASDIEQAAASISKVIQLRHDEESADE